MRSASSARRFTSRSVSSIEGGFFARESDCPVATVPRTNSSSTESGFLASGNCAEAVPLLPKTVTPTDTTAMNKALNHMDFTIAVASNDESRVATKTQTVSIVATFHHDTY